MSQKTSEQRHESNMQNVCTLRCGVHDTKPQTAHRHERVSSTKDTWTKSTQQQLSQLLATAASM